MLACCQKLLLRLGSLLESSCCHASAISQNSPWNPVHTLVMRSARNKTLNGQSRFNWFSALHPIQGIILQSLQTRQALALWVKYDAVHENRPLVTGDWARAYPLSAAKWHVGCTGMDLLCRLLVRSSLQPTVKHGCLWVVARSKIPPCVPVGCSRDLHPPQMSDTHYKLRHGGPNLTFPIS